MAVFKSSGELLSAEGRRLGSGQVYLHLPRGLTVPQEGSGTVSLRSWTDSGEAPASLRLAEGGLLALTISRDAISECSQRRVLRFSTRWPGQAS